MSFVSFIKKNFTISALISFIVYKILGTMFDAIITPVIITQFRASVIPDDDTIIDNLRILVTLISLFSLLYISYYLTLY